MRGSFLILTLMFTQNTNLVPLTQEPQEPQVNFTFPILEVTVFELKTTTGQLWWHTPVISGEEDGVSDTGRGKMAFRKLSAQIA